MPNGKRNEREEQRTKQSPRQCQQNGFSYGVYLIHPRISNPRQFPDYNKHLSLACHQIIRPGLSVQTKRSIKLTSISKRAETKPFPSI